MKTHWRDASHYLRNTATGLIEIKLHEFYIYQLAYYPVGTGGSFPGVKAAGREADHSLPTSVEFENGGAIPSTPPYVFMA
jgi:hypothetical protein